MRVFIEDKEAQKTLIWSIENGIDHGGLWNIGQVQIMFDSEYKVRYQNELQIHTS